MNQNPELTINDIAKNYLENQLNDPINKLLSDFFDYNVESKKTYFNKIEKEFSFEKNNLDNFNQLIDLASNRIKIEQLKIKKNYKNKDGNLVYQLSFNENDLSIIEFYPKAPLLKNMIQLKSKVNEEFILYSRRESGVFEFEVQFINKKKYENEILIKSFLKRDFTEKLKDNKELLKNLEEFVDAIFVMKNAVLGKIPEHILYSDILEDINLLNVKEEDFDLIKLKTDVDLREPILYVKNYISRMNKTLENKIKI